LIDLLNIKMKTNTFVRGGNAILQSTKMNKSLGLLLNTPLRNYQLQRIHVYDQGGRNSVSGINATIFGATS